MGLEVIIKLKLSGILPLRQEHRIDGNPLQPVFISAQTGPGKNYFVEHELILYIRELRKH